MRDAAPGKPRRDAAGAQHAPLKAAIALATSISKLDGEAVARAKRLVVAGERLHERLDEQRAGNATSTGAVGALARPAKGASDVD